MPQGMMQQQMQGFVSAPGMMPVQPQQMQPQYYSNMQPMQQQAPQQQVSMPQVSMPQQHMPMQGYPVTSVPQQILTTTMPQTTALPAYTELQPVPNYPLQFPPATHIPTPTNQPPPVHPVAPPPVIQPTYVNISTPAQSYAQSVVNSVPSSDQLSVTPSSEVSNVESVASTMLLESLASDGVSVQAATTEEGAPTDESERYVCCCLFYWFSPYFIIGDLAFGQTLIALKKKS
jgi:hypothetical protein